MTDKYVIYSEIKWQSSSSYRSLTQTKTDVDKKNKLKKSVKI